MMRRSDQRGFTFMDLLVGSTIAMVVGAGAVSFVRAQSLAGRTQMAQTDMNDEVRGVIELMAREIRVAGYNPLCITAPPPVAAIVVAEPQRLQMQADLNENGVLDAATEDITYQYDGGTSALQR